MARAQVTILVVNSFRPPLDVFARGWLMWCHAIAADVRRTATQQIFGERTMHTIEIIDGLMCVMDEDGNGYDAAVLTGLRAATRQIQTWTNEYTIDVADANRQLHNYFSQR